MKKMIIVFLLLSLLIPTGVIAANKNLSDIEVHWGREYIESLVDRGIINGYPDGSFKPDDSMARDAFIKMTVVALGYNPGNAKGYWAQNYIDKAIELNLIALDEFESYTEPILREEMASIVVNAVLKDEFEHNVNLYDYVREDIKDYGAISDKYKQRVLNSYGFGLITGFDGYFRPQGTATRAEAATIITRYIDENIRQPYQVDASVPTVELENVLDRTQMMTVYPKKGAEEMIDIAKVLKATVEIGEGYGDLKFNPLENVVHITYYPNKEDLELSSVASAMAQDFSLTIYTLNWGEKHSAPYTIPVWDQEDIKKYHLDVFEVIFTALFEDEKDFAMDKLQKLSLIHI